MKPSQSQEMKPNTIHPINFLHNTLEPGCADLIIADPPYFEVKGSFDFGVWPDFAAYLADVELWAAECKRILAPAGTLLWWGHPLKIAYSQIILDRHFDLLNSGVWEKPDSQCRRNRPSDQRRFIPVTERCLVYGNFNQSENDWKNNNAAVYWEGFEPIRLALRDWVKRAGGVQVVAKACGVSGRAVGHWTSKSQWYFPAQANLDALAGIIGGNSGAEFERLRAEFERLRAEFERLRAEFERKVRRPFTLPTVRGGNGMTDVWLYSTEASKTAQHDHETQKPERLTSMLVRACSRHGGLVVVPFAGSGTECAMAAKEGRRFIGFEIDEAHVLAGNKRAGHWLAQPGLF